MGNAAWLGGVFSVAIGVGGLPAPVTPVPATPEPVTVALSDQVVRVPMDHSHRRIEVPVRIDNRGPYLFVLDTTSAAAFVIDPELAGSLRDAARDERSDAVPILATFPLPPADGGEATTVVIGSLQLGAADFLGIEAVVRALPDADGGRIRGVLGLPLFADLLLTIDYADSMLILSRGALPPDAADVFALLGPGAVPHLALQVGGEVWSACIDTGNTDNLTFPSRLAQSLPTQRSPVVLGSRGRGVARVLQGARLAEPLLVAGHSYQQLPVLFADDATEPHLGYGLLAHYVLTFDQRQSLVRFRLPSAVQVATDGAADGPVPAGAGYGGAWTAVHTDPVGVGL